MKLRRVTLVVLALVALAGSAAAQARGAAHIPLPADLTGTMNGAPYEIRVPANWNGTLLVWAHGWQAFGIVAEIAPPATWPEATPPVQDQLLAQGYALAGSGYPNSMKESVQDTLALTVFFKRAVGNPQRTIIWGSSLGGWVALRSIEDYPQIYDAAIPTCAVAAGWAMDADWMLSYSLAYKAAYGWLDDRWGPVGNLVDDLNFWTEVLPYVQWPASDLDYGKWEFIRLVMKMPYDAFWGWEPMNASNFFGMDMWKVTEARAHWEALAGGPVAQNAGLVYALADEDKQYLASLGVDADALLASMNAQTNIRSDIHARHYIEHWGDLGGNIHRPVLTLHSIFDGLVIVQNEAVYAANVAKHQKSDRLVQAFVDFPAHNSFSAEQYLSLIAAMNSWLDTGVRPDATALPASLGFDLNFVPQPWPFAYAEKSRDGDRDNDRDQDRDR